MEIVSQGSVNAHQVYAVIDARNQLAFRSELLALGLESVALGLAFLAGTAAFGFAIAASDRATAYPD